MHIRNTQPGDFSRCVEISHAAWPFLKERESIYHLFCRFCSNTSFILENNEGRIIAFLFGFISQADPSEAYIHLAAVEPAWQRQGITTMLYDAFFERVEWLGADRVRLIVSPENAPSRSFHEQIGFVADIRGPVIFVGGVAAHENYNGPGLHMVTYLREL